MTRLDMPEELVQMSRPPVGDSAGACRRADELCDSNRARAQEPSPPKVDARADSLGGALSSGGHATDTAHARDRPEVPDPGGVEHPQGAIGLGALLGRVQPLACWTAKCPIGLEGKVLSRKATSFPGGSGGEWSIAC